MKTMTQFNDEWKNLPGWTDKELHRYFSLCYEEEFLPFKDKPVDLLEIGCGYGGALKIWSNWFNDANLIGIEHTDHSPEGKTSRGENYIETFLTNSEDNPNVKILIKNAYSKEVADSLGLFDIIVDDGYHTMEQWNELIKLYLPKLKPGGILTIEDIGRRLIDRPNGFDVQELLNIVPSGYKTKVYDLSTVTGIHDSRVVIIYN